jgi:hypothetical protein
MSTPATTRPTTCARGRSRREGQRLDADELLAQVTGERIDFAVMVEEI